MSQITEKELTELQKKAKEYDELRKDIEQAEKELPQETGETLEITDKEPVKEKNLCGNCQTEVKEGQKYCYGCGEQLDW